MQRLAAATWYLLSSRIDQPSIRPLVNPQEREVAPSVGRSCSRANQRARSPIEYLIRGFPAGPIRLCETPGTEAARGTAQAQQFLEYKHHTRYLPGPMQYKHLLFQQLPCCSASSPTPWSSSSAHGCQRARHC